MYILDIVLKVATVCGSNTNLGRYLADCIEPGSDIK